MISNESPFARFYDQIFATSTQEEQTVFLRQLFTIDASLCNRYFNYINFTLVDHPIEDLIESIEAEVLEIKKGIIAFNWENLFQTVPGTPDDYIEDVDNILHKVFFDEMILSMKANFSNGNLLIALKELRIIELSLDFDWENMLEEPACYYQDDVDSYGIISEFNYADAYMGDSIFSVEILEVAQNLISYFIANPMKYTPHTESWQVLLDDIDERLKKLK